MSDNPYAAPQVAESAARRPASRFESTIRLVALLIGFYAPYAWLFSFFFNVTRWQDYHTTWLMMWPILPGILPAAYFFHPHTMVELSAMALITFLLLAGLIILARSGRRGFVVALVIATLWSSISSLIAYQLYRF